MAQSIVDAPLPARVLLHAWCKAIVECLGEAGVTELVISPGSRNTPLTLSALESDVLRCHSVIDERAAGFLALGMARATRAPAALLCTSGTAAAHYYPALIEASYDGIPLVVISADRPEELQECGAPQTINQRELFGSFVRATLPLHSPQDSREAFTYLKKATRNLIANASAPRRPGPVHLNVPLRKPLEPQRPSTKAQRERVASLLHVAHDAVPQQCFPQLPELASLLEARRSALRPLVVAGPVAPHEAPLVESVAESLQAPLLSEFGSPSSSGLELSAPLLVNDQAPDFLLHLGPPVVSSSWSRSLESYSGRYFVFSGTEYREPSRRAERTITAPLRALASQLRTRAAQMGDLPSVNPAFHSLTEKGARAVRSALPPDSGTGLNEPFAVRSILRNCPREANLVLGNSLSLRLASWVWPTLTHPPAPFTARGVNGIDGTVAWATGVARATKTPTLALLGDVTFSHDIGSLQLLRDGDLPLVLVILDNQGGRIFDHLPIHSELAPDEASYWTTPPRLDFSEVARAFGIAFVRATHPEEIERVVPRALNSSHPTVVHVPTDPASTKQFLAKVREEYAS